MTDPSQMMPQVEKTSTFQKAIEAVEALSPDAQVILIDLVYKRLKQQRRDELLQAVAEACEDNAKGNVRSGSVTDLLAEMNN